MELLETLQTAVPFIVNLSFSLPVIGFGLLAVFGIVFVVSVQ